MEDKAQYRIRAAKREDLDQVSLIETRCFPSAEAAGRDSLGDRITAFSGSFFVAEDQEGRLIGFINGGVTDSQVICDEMFEDVGLHRPEGAYQSIFGLDVVPEWRHKKVASSLMNHLILAAKEAGRKGLILTCKEHLIPYYQSFGYKNLGLSASVHGGAVWYDMILEVQRG